MTDKAVVSVYAINTCTNFEQSTGYIMSAPFEKVYAMITVYAAGRSTRPYLLTEREPSSRASSPILLLSLRSPNRSRAPLLSKNPRTACSVRAELAWLPFRRAFACARYS
jgi:hypothetical protein